MKLISSRKTFFVKRVTPIIATGIMLSFLVTVFMLFQKGRMTAEDIFWFLVMPAIMAVFAVLVFREIYWKLADKVQDGGHFLLVRKSGVEERIVLSDVVNVSMATYSNPQVLTLRLRKPWKFGEEVVFIPVKKWSFDPFARNEVAEDLIRRCNAARRNGALT